MNSEAVEEILKELSEGKIKLHEVDKKVADILKCPDANVATDIRRRNVEIKTGVSLKHTGHYSIDMNKTSHDNLTIGVVQYPVKYVGDLRVNGEYANGEYPIFLAVTEGLLAAGAARAVSVFNEAGGITTRIIKDGMTRDVLIKTSGISDSKKIYNFIRSDEGKKFLKNEFDSQSKHVKLLDIEPFVDGEYLHIRYVASTGAVMGMNAVTELGRYATEALQDYAEKNLNIKFDVLTVSGNMCTDKKPSYIDVLHGRGMSIETEGFIPKDLVKRKFFGDDKNLDECVARVAEVNYAKNDRGSRLAGSFGYNTHVANALAALYLAYGQDVAQIVEGSMARIDIKAREDGLAIHGSFPALELGTYGGETGWGVQKELLTATGVYGEGDDTGITRYKLGEIVAAAATAIDVNLTAVQAAGKLKSTRKKR